jgi:hypothetical protein
MLESGNLKDSVSRCFARFGVLKYSSQNIGDEIQSIAAMRFLPRIDYYCHRERLDQFHVDSSDAGKKVKLIMNAWWMWQPAHFPPSDDIDPLLISMHLRKAAHEKFERPEILDYFRKHGPVGCRDMTTKAFLEAHDVPAYFSGCLTTTLKGNPTFREKHGNDYILCVDLPKHLEKEIRNRTDRPVYNISRMLSPAFTAIDRLELAKVILALYHNAHCIVTSRLHVSLPSTAFGTPVLLINLNTEDRRGRFDGMESFFNQVAEDDFLQNKTIYNFDAPPKNPEAFLATREALVEKASAFTGYDSPTSVFEDDYEPMIALMNLLHVDLSADRSIVTKMLTFATKDELLEALYQKQIKKKSKHDLKI